MNALFHDTRNKHREILLYSIDIPTPRNTKSNGFCPWTPLASWQPQTPLPVGPTSRAPANLLFYNEDLILHADWSQYLIIIVSSSQDLRSENFTNIHSQFLAIL